MKWISIASFLLPCCWRSLFVDADALHPIRFGTEEEFFRANTHERSKTAAEMESKIEVMRKRRNFQRWNASNPAVEALLKTKRPNILFILADDLGYGDLSVEPFTTHYDQSQWPCVEGGILTPTLERMAAEGAILTNFHAAAPVCSPSRAAIMTGLYSWRLNAMNAFEVSKEDLTQLNGFLPQVPTLAEMLREEGYFTAHSGKWHIGGMREDARKRRVEQDDCSVPGPNQHGFEEYISALDGPESPRYSFLNREGGLHLTGYRHRIKNDVPMPIEPLPGPEQHALSDYEAADAIAFMEQAQKDYPNQPWFVQLWFNAPHGPYDVLLSGEQLYSDKYNTSHAHWQAMRCKAARRDDPLYTTRWMYKTMVSAMDRSIETVMQALQRMGVDNDTLVIFTSDNGPEYGAGTGGAFRQGKRSLMEGGVRVPAIWRWKGVIPAGSYSSTFSSHTDLLPTLLHAAGLHTPAGMRFDGLSLLPVLRKALPVPADRSLLHQHQHYPQQLGIGEAEMRKLYFSSTPLHTPSHTPLHTSVATKGNGNGSEELTLWQLQAGNRVHLWHKACDPFGPADARRQSGGVYEHIKLLANEDGCVDRVFDLRYDPTEQLNLLQGAHCAVHFNSVSLHGLQQALSTHYAKQHCNQQTQTQQQTEPAEQAKCQQRYLMHLVRRAGTVLAKLIPFFRYGKQGYQNYMDEDYRKATCSVPLASQAQRMRFTNHSECQQDSKYGCSQPEYAMLSHIA